MSNKADQLSHWKWMVRLLGCFKIPMIAFVRPQILQVDAVTVRAKIRLKRRTRNHLKSMYFGALAVGADLTAGIHAFYFAEKEGEKISFAFKGMKAEFLKRAESDVVFVTNDGPKIKAAVEESKRTGDRQNIPVNVECFNSTGEVVATFEMITSIKVVSK